MTKWEQDYHLKIPQNGYLWSSPFWNSAAWHTPVARQLWWWDHDSPPPQSCAPAQVNNPAALSSQRAVNTIFSLSSENLPFPTLASTQCSLAKRNLLLKIRGDILKKQGGHRPYDSQSQMLRKQDHHFVLE